MPLLPPIRARSYKSRKKKITRDAQEMRHSSVSEPLSVCLIFSPLFVIWRGWPVSWSEDGFPPICFDVSNSDVLKNGKKAGRQLLHILSHSWLGNFAVFEERPLVFLLFTQLITSLCLLHILQRCSEQSSDISKWINKRCSKLDVFLNFT